METPSNVDKSWFKNKIINPYLTYLMSQKIVIQKDSKIELIKSVIPKYDYDYEIIRILNILELNKKFKDYIT